MTARGTALECYDRSMTGIIAASVFATTMML